MIPETRIRLYAIAIITIIALCCLVDAVVGEEVAQTDIIALSDFLDTPDFPPHVEVETDFPTCPGMTVVSMNFETGSANEAIAVQRAAAFAASRTVLFSPSPDTLFLVWPEFTLDALTTIHPPEFDPEIVCEALKQRGIYIQRRIFIANDPE